MIFRKRGTAKGRNSLEGGTEEERRTVLLFAEFGSFGGTRTYFFNLVEFYLSQGLRLVAALAQDQVDEEVRKKLAAFGVEWYLIRSRPASARSLWNRMPFTPLFDLLAGIPLIRSVRPDLVACSIADPGNWLGLILLRPRFLYVLHTLPLGSSRSGAERMLTRRIGGRRMILTVSEFARRTIQRSWGGERDLPVEVVHNPIVFAPDSASRRAQVSGGTRRVLTLGHIREYKNPIGWIEVARRVLNGRGPDVEFIWAGEGEMLDTCLGVLDSAERERIRFVGRERPVRELYSEADVYFQPSFVESHGMAVVDAMAWGLPCVVADTGGLPESVIDGETGFVVRSHEVDTMAERISTLLADSDLRTRMGTAGRERSAKLFGRDVWRQKMADLHQRIMQA